MKIRCLLLAAAFFATNDAQAKDEKIYRAVSAETPPENVVHLKVREDGDRRDQIFFKSGNSVLVSNVDGNSLANFWVNGRRLDEAVLSTGKHEITFLVVSNWGSGYTSLWFVAESGHHYAVRKEIAYNSYRIWIEDETTGRMTGGLVGSEDEPADGATSLNSASGAPNQQ